MQLDLANLLDDTKQLHLLVRDMAANLEHRDSEIERLRLIVKQLQRGQFGRSSECLDPHQLSLGLEDIATDIGEVEARKPSPTPVPDDKPRRNMLPDHLPRHDVVLDDIASDDAGACCCPACKGMLHSIGESISEMLDYVTAKLRVIRIHRPKYACRTCGTAVHTEAQQRVIAGGLATPALLTQFLVAKYCDHTPLYRHHKSLRGTVLNWHAQRSPDGWVERASSAPTSCSFNIPMISSFVNRLRFILWSSLLG
jgi:transposase